MKMKIEECSKKPLTTGALPFVYVLWGLLSICTIQAILDYHGYLKWFYPDIYPDIEIIENDIDSLIQSIKDCFTKKITLASSGEEAPEVIEVSSSLFTFSLLPSNEKLVNFWLITMKPSDKIGKIVRKRLKLSNWKYI